MQPNLLQLSTHTLASTRETRKHRHDHSSHLELKERCAIDFGSVDLVFILSLIICRFTAITNPQKTKEERESQKEFSNSTPPKCTGYNRLVQVVLFVFVTSSASLSFPSYISDTHHIGGFDSLLFFFFLPPPPPPFPCVFHSYLVSVLFVCLFALFINILIF